MRTRVLVGSSLWIVLLGACGVACSSPQGGASPTQPDPEQTGTVSQPLWQNLTCCAQGGVAATSWSTTRVDVFVNSSNQTIWHRACNSGSCTPSQWTQWDNNPGGPPGGAIGRPGAVSMSNGRIDLFVLGTNNIVWQRTYLPSLGWQPWSNLSCCLASAPVATSWDSNSLDIWAKGTDGNIWHRACRNLSQNCIGDGAFSTWEDSPGAPPVGIASAYPDPGAAMWG